MILSNKTFVGMVKTFRSVYGADWRSDLDNDKNAQLTFFKICQAVIPEELVNELVQVFCTTRAKAPASPYDIVQAYLDKQVESALSSDDAIDRIVTAISDYEYSDSEFDSCDEYLFSNVIGIFPCSSGVRQFYERNKSILQYLALYSPTADERVTIYKNLGFDYRKMLQSSERRAIIQQINQNALPGTGTIGEFEPHNIEQLEA